MKNTKSRKNSVRSRIIRRLAGFRDRQDGSKAFGAFYLPEISPAA